MLIASAAELLAAILALLAAECLESLLLLAATGAPVAWLREADAEFSRAVAASPGLRDLANLGFLQLDLVRAYCALGAAAAS